MEIKDKEKFFNALYDLLDSVDHISYVGIDGIEDYLYKQSLIMKTETYDPTEDERSNYTCVKEWMTQGPLFIIFTQEDLDKEVQDYIVDRILKESKLNNCKCDPNLCVECTCESEKA